MKKTTKNPLAGAWKLVSFEVRRKNGQTHYPFGGNASGQLIYTENGHVTANLSQNGRMEVKTGDIMDASHEEMAASFRGYISYFGQYEFDEKNSVVLHHVEGSLFPNWIGDTLKRNVKFIGDRIELSTEPLKYGSEEVTGVVVWEKILV
jgi:hypothetical protein